MKTKSESGFSLVVLIILIVLVCSLTASAYYLGKKTTNSTKNQTITAEKEQTTVTSITNAILTKTNASPTVKPEPQADKNSVSVPFPSSPTVKPTLISNGANLNEITFILPVNWTSKLNKNDLFLSPVNGGGYLDIVVHEYPANTGRREFFCQITHVCIEETTFTPIQMGNISGYKADTLDNSGGGGMYFGAKGNKFYVISSYGPPKPNDFDDSYNNVLASLKF